MPTFWNMLYVPSSEVYDDGTECSKTLEFKLKAPVNNPEECIQHSEHGESLKSRNSSFFILFDKQ
jgi:hypothetical protein